MNNKTIDEILEIKMRHEKQIAEAVAPILVSLELETGLAIRRIIIDRIETSDSSLLKLAGRVEIQLCGI